jgi:hypothetical protein
MRRLKFENVKRVYPADRIGNEAEAYQAFCAAIGGRRLTDVIEAVKNLMWDRGAHVPWLAEALAIIERGQPHGTGRQ